MTSPSVSFVVLSRATAGHGTSLKSRLQREYTKDLWLFLASVIAFFTLLNIVRKSLAAIASRSASQHEKTGGEAAQPGNTGKISLRRLPLAVASSFRIAAFRIPIACGFGASASPFEVTFIALYMVFTFVLLFINSTSCRIRHRFHCA